MVGEQGSVWHAQEVQCWLAIRLRILWVAIVDTFCQESQDQTTFARNVGYIVWVVKMRTIVMSVTQEPTPKMDCALSALEIVSRQWFVNPVKTDKLNHVIRVWRATRRLATPAKNAQWLFLGVRNVPWWDPSWVALCALMVITECRVPLTLVYMGVAHVHPPTPNTFIATKTTLPLKYPYNRHNVQLQVCTTHHRPTSLCRCKPIHQQKHASPILNSAWWSRMTVKIVPNVGMASYWWRANVSSALTIVNLAPSMGSLSSAKLATKTTTPTQIWLFVYHVLQVNISHDWRVLWLW